MDDDEQHLVMLDRHRALRAQDLLEGQVLPIALRLAQVPVDLFVGEGRGFRGFGHWKKVCCLWSAVYSQIPSFSNSDSDAGCGLWTADHGLAAPTQTPIPEHSASLAPTRGPSVCSSAHELRPEPRSAWNDSCASCGRVHERADIAPREDRGITHMHSG